MPLHAMESQPLIYGLFKLVPVVTEFFQVARTLRYTRRIHSASSVRAQGHSCSSRWTGARRARGRGFGHHNVVEVHAARPHCELAHAGAHHVRLARMNASRVLHSVVHVQDARMH